MNHAAEACKQAEKDRREMEQRNKKETASTVTPSGTDPSVTRRKQTKTTLPTQ